jgi:hypothetical protein
MDAQTPAERRIPRAKAVDSASTALERSISDEIIYGRGPALRVFVSSKMRDHSLDAERMAAVRAIDSYPPHRAWAWERDSAAGSYSASKLCIKIAGASDGLVLILGDDLTPITKREYFAAKRGAVPRYLLLKDGATRTPSTDAFVQRERKHVVTKKFRNSRELRSHVRNSLGQRLVFLSREAIAASGVGR